MSVRVCAYSRALTFPPHLCQDPQTSRTLKLISKTINSLGSCVGSRSSVVSCKEEYMMAINKDFFTDSYLQKLRLVSVTVAVCGTGRGLRTLSDLSARSKSHQRLNTLACE